MKAQVRTKSNDKTALTFIEVICAVLALCIMAVTLRAFLNRNRAIGAGTSCLSHLKQMGIGFRLYGNDNDGFLPMNLSTNAGGSLEYTNDVLMAWQHFKAAGDELAHPAILLCPQGPKILPFKATNFNSVSNNLFLDYFVGIHADESYPGTILAGDANLFLNAKLLPKSIGFQSSSNYTWGERHSSLGNIVLADGSAQQLSSTGMVKAVFEDEQEKHKKFNSQQRGTAM